jgi:hypothetical protein
MDRLRGLFGRILLSRRQSRGCVATLLCSCALLFLSFCKNGLTPEMIRPADIQPGTNVALQSNGGAATASSVGSYSGYVGYAGRGNDGDTTNEGWCGTSIPAWLRVQFDRAYTIDTVRIHWGSHQQTFSVSLSTDAASWTTVVSSRQSPNSEGESGGQTYSITPTNARYIRVYVTATSAPHSHIFQAIVSELEAISSGARP